MPVPSDTHTHPPSPHILTPSDPSSPHAFSFPKQPIQSRKPTSHVYSGTPSLAGTDSEAGLSDGPTFSSISDGPPPTQSAHPHPVSLLTALLHSPDHQIPASQQRPAPSHAGVASAQSSAPSTTLSSPSGQHHGILHHGPQQQIKFDPSQAPPTASILRRGSTGNSSEAGDAVGLGIGMGLTSLDGLARRLERVEERRERVGWADEVESKAPSADISRANSNGPAQRHTLKFAVAPHMSAASEAEKARADAVPDAEDEEDEDEDEEDEDATPETEFNLPGFPQPASPALKHDDADDSDEGYQEDEEDGMFSDDDDDYYAPKPAARRASFPLNRLPSPSPQFPFARSTNYAQSDGPHDSSPPTAPAVLPPPNRRGRGHVRVDAAYDKPKACSRHCSPPPQSRSRSSSNAHDVPPAASSPSARRLPRRDDASSVYTSDAGPRAGRAGSPMPTGLANVSDDDEEDEEDEEEDEDANETEDAPLPTPPKAPSGWRSDDSVFYGPNSRQVRPIRLEPVPRHVSAPPPVFVDSDDEGGDPPASVGGGVSHFLRRASEHLSGFRRPSLSLNRDASDSGSASAVLVPPSTESSPIPTSDRVSCPPALDSTPAVAASLSRAHEPSSLAERLEKTLAIPAQPISVATDTGSANLSRTRSLGSRVTFQPPPSSHPRRHRARSVQPMSADERMVAQTRPIKIVKGRSEELGWSHAALLQVRKKAGEENGV